MLAISILNSLHQPLVAILISVVRLFGLMLPLAYVGAMVYGVTGVYLGAATANILIGILSYLLMQQRLRLLDEAHVQRPVS